MVGWQHLLLALGKQISNFPRWCLARGVGCAIVPSPDRCALEAALPFIYNSRLPASSCHCTFLYFLVFSSFNCTIVSSPHLTYLPYYSNCPPSIANTSHCISHCTISAVVSAGFEHKDSIIHRQSPARPLDQLTHRNSYARTGTQPDKQATGTQFIYALTSLAHF